MVDLLTESCGHDQGEEDGEDGGVGLQVDADWAEVETEGGDLAVEEPPLDDDSGYSETGGEEGDSEEGIGAVSDSDLRAEERSLDGQEPVQLEEHQGQQVVGSPKQTDRLVKAELGVQADNCVQNNNHLTPKEAKDHDKEVVSLEDMAGPQIM